MKPSTYNSRLFQTHIFIFFPLSEHFAFTTTMPNYPVPKTENQQRAQDERRERRRRLESEKAKERKERYEEELEKLRGGESKEEGKREQGKEEQGMEGQGMEDPPPPPYSKK